VATPRAEFMVCGGGRRGLAVLGRDADVAARALWPVYAAYGGIALALLWG
jgi:hypothetical protein